MNRSSSNSLALSQAITGYLNYKSAEGLSDRTIDSYRRILQHWAEYTGETQIRQLTSQNIGDYLLHLRNDPEQYGEAKIENYTPALPACSKSFKQQVPLYCSSLLSSGKPLLEFSIV